LERRRRGRPRRGATLASRARETEAQDEKKSTGGCQTAEGAGVVHRASRYHHRFCLGAHTMNARPFLLTAAVSFALLSPLGCSVQEESGSDATVGEAELSAARA